MRHVDHNCFYFLEGLNFYDPINAAIAARNCGEAVYPMLKETWKGDMKHIFFVFR